MSIAKATGRKFVRLSLGGVRDEAEIRGHRRTYIGALPGQIIQMMKKSGTKNPVFMLDEIDKMSHGFPRRPVCRAAGSPRSGTEFHVHGSLPGRRVRPSQVFFIATANVLHTIPAALQDRMEVIRLSGYTEFEKLEIAKRFLVPKQVKDTGIAGDQVEFTTEGLQTLVQSYTREAGVRNLEREVGNVCRKVARKVVDAQSNGTRNSSSGECRSGRGGSRYGREASQDRKKTAKERRVCSAGSDRQGRCRPQKVTELLGPARFRDLEMEKKNEIGATTGLRGPKWVVRF